MTLAAQVEEFAASHHLPAVVLGVVDKSGLTDVVEHGYADPDGRVPATRDTLFRIASITKTFTATAVMQLRDANAVTLDDPLVAHLPEFEQVGGLAGAAPRVTLRHLLQHSSGLQGEPPSLDLLEQPVHTGEQILQVLPRTRLLTAPGTAFRYSNLGFRLLAEVLARVTGTRWLELAPTRLLQPLGMLASGPRPADLSRCATGHRPSLFQDRPEPVDPIDSALAEGDGDLWSSLTDLSRWVTTQLGAVRGDDSVVLSASSLLEMQQPTLVADPAWTEARGLGWNVLRREHGRVVSHGGLFGGFNSQLCFSPEHQIGVVALTNSVPETSVADLALPILDDLSTARTRSVAGTSSLTPVPVEWTGLLGRYHDQEDGQSISIEFRRGQLVCRDRDTSYPLEPGGEPLVFLVDLEEWRFVTDEAGQVIALNAHGYPLFKEQS